MASVSDDGTVHTTGASSVPEDPPRTSHAYALSYIPAKGLSIILLIIAILLCLEGMELAFVTFMVLGILIEVADLICGFKHLQQIQGGVDRCISGWKARVNHPG